MKTINFEIIANENENVYQKGYVEVPEDIEQTSEWFYYDQQGFAIPRVFTHHDEIGINQIGATDEQESDIEEFNKAIIDEIDFINDAILNAEENENRTYVRKDITIIVNDGAKFEVEIYKYDPVDFYTNYSTALEIGRQYFMTFKPKYNGKSVVNIIEEYLEYGILEDPYTYDIITTKTPKINQEQADFNKDSIAMEVPKSCFEWEDDYEEDIVEEILSEYKDSLESAYRKALVHHIGIYGIASSMYEEKLKKENSMEVFNESRIQDYGNAWEDYYVDSKDLWTLTNLTSEDVEKIVKEELNRDDY